LQVEERAEVASNKAKDTGEDSKCSSEQNAAVLEPSSVFRIYLFYIVVRSPVKDKVVE